MVKSRPEVLGQYIVDNNCTIREAARVFCISKSTVHNDISKRLKYENYELFLMVKKVMIHNFEVKHLRGGYATKLKFEKKKKWLISLLFLWLNQLIFFQLISPYLCCLSW